MNEAIVIHFRPELRDQIWGSIVHYRAGRTWVRDRIVGTIALVAGLMVYSQSGWRWWLAILFAIGIAEWTDFLHAHTLRAWFSFARDPKFSEDYTLGFAPEGLHFKTATIDSIIAWSHFDRAIEDSELFLLMTGRSMYSVIPRRAFAGENEVDRFRELIQQMIPAYSRQNF